MNSWLHRILASLFLISVQWILGEPDIVAQVNLDSLQRVWQDTNQPDSSRQNALHKIAEVKKVSSQIDSAIYYHQLNISLFEKSEPTFNQGKVWINLGILYDELEQYSEALVSHQKGLEIFELIGSKKGIVSAHFGLGLFYVRNHNYEKALFHYNLCEDIYLNLGDQKGFAHLLHNIGFLYSQKDQYDSAVHYYTESLKIREEMGEMVAIARSTANLGVIHYNQGKFDDATQFFEKSLSIFQELKDDKSSAIVFINLGNVYERKKQLDLAASYFYQAIKIFEKLNDKINASFLLANLGNLYMNQNDWRKAEEYLNQSLQLRQDLGNKVKLADIMTALGVLYSKKEAFTKADSFFQKSLDVYQSAEGKKGEANVLNHLGSLYYRQKQYPQALEMYQTSLGLFREIGSKTGIAGVLSRISKYHVEQKQFELAISKGEKCLKLAREIGDIFLIKEITESLYTSYKALGNTQNALSMHESYIQARDSIEKESNQRALFEQEYRYQYEKKSLADSLSFIKQKAGSDLVNQAKLLRRNYFIYAVIALAIIGFAFLRYWQIRRAKEQTRQLIHQEKEAQRLRELDALKTRLYANITHEFRTPLTVILGMAEEAKSYFIKHDQEAFDQAIEMVKRNSNSLLMLVNQMLELAQLKAKGLILNNQQGEVIAYLCYLCESFQSYAEAKDIYLKVQPEIGFQIMDHDPDKLLSIISNLLSNAIKFTPEGGEVIVHISQHENTLQIIVQDSGIGISTEDLNHIFDRFYQARQSESYTNQGTGLGLALVKELIVLMGGSIQVESQLEKGSTFTINLPILLEATLKNEIHELETIKQQVRPYFQINEVLSTETVKQGNLPLILIIEDNADVQHYLHEFLHHDFRCLLASDGQAGLELAKKELPDLIISDVMMPRMDGFALCEALREDILTSHIPFILLTARDTVEDRIAGLRHGADVYLAKPFNREELLIQIHNLIEIRQQLKRRYADGNIIETESVEGEVDLKIEDAFVLQMRELVQTQLDNPELDVSWLCGEIGLSRSQLHRKLTALTGLSAIRFIWSIRLTAAAELLKESDIGMSQVAYQCGFNDPAYFSRKFSQAYGCSPSEYQNQMLKG